MTMSWMVYGILIGLLVALAARGLELAGRLAGYSVRWIWAGAIALTVAFIVAAPYRGAPAATVSLVATAGTPVTVSGRSTHPSWTALPSEVLRRVQVGIASAAAATLTIVRRTVPSVTAGYLLPLWIAASTMFGLLFVGVHLRFSRVRRRWPATDLHGVRVRVTPQAGPAVIGLSHPEIIVPRWLLGRRTDEQRLVVMHEAEHVRARDPLLLAAGCVAVVLLPWNPALWWMLSRLRLAVELDCDARVLRAGAVPRSYGALLIDLAEHCSGLRVGAPALADDSSHLRTRLMAMQSRAQLTRFARARGGVFSLLALSLIVVACEAKLPTDTDVQEMTAASAERAMVADVKKGAAERMNYTIDGLVVTADQAHALDAEKIATINVVKTAAGRQIAITRADTIRYEPQQMKVAERTVEGHAIVAPETRAKSPGAGAFTGIVFINGTRVDASAIGRLDPRDIVSVDVIKGVAAARLYSDAEAANGVIKIVTRSGGTSK